MPASKHAGIIGKRRNDVLNGIVVTGAARLLVGDIEVVTARESDPQHNGCHAHAP